MSLKVLLKIILSDLSRYKETYRIRRDSKNFALICLESFLFKSGFQAVFFFRLAHYFHKNNLGYLAWGITRFNQFLTSAEIEYNAEIGSGLFIAHPSGIVIGRGAKIGKNVNMYQGITIGTRNLKNIEFPTIADGVTLFAGSKILGDVFVGLKSIIGANALVVHDVLPSSIVLSTESKKINEN